MSNTLIEKRSELKSRSVVSIEPYFDPEVPNMGLEKYGLSGFPGGGENQDLSSMEMGNKITFVTGLDPTAKLIRDIEDTEEKEAKIKEILAVVRYLEDDCSLGKDTLDANNIAFWCKISINLEHNKRIDLDMKDPYDLIKYYAIKAGGFPCVAPDYETAKKGNRPVKWYLEELAETAAIKTEIKKERANAISKLQDVFRKNPKALIMIAKVVLTTDNQFKLSTPIDVVYDKLYDFIQGDIVKTNKKLTPKQFMQAAESDKQTIHLSALVKDAIFYKVLHRKSDGFYYNLETQTAYGKNEPELVEFLRNPLNQSELENLSDRIEKKWM